MKIMLVDDSRTLRNIERHTLNELGHTDIIEAGDGIEALGMITQGMPDLFLVDWNMPNMDGLALVKKLRELDKQVPIIMVTTEAEKSRVVEALKAGVNNYVIKPFTPQLLNAKIEQTLEKLNSTASC